MTKESTNFYCYCPRGCGKIVSGRERHNCVVRDDDPELITVGPRVVQQWIDPCPGPDGRTLATFEWESDWVLCVTRADGRVEHWTHERDINGTLAHLFTEGA